jgi:hypothetical protein
MIKDSEFAGIHLGLPGRMISGSKSGYRQRFPHNLTVFNANLCTESEKIWWGDIDLTFDYEKLEILANAIDKKIYVLYEMDGRFENEEKPRLDQATVVFSPDTPYEIGKRIRDYVNDDLTLKE